MVNKCEKNIFDDYYDRKLGHHVELDDDVTRTCIWCGQKCSNDNPPEGGYNSIADYLGSEVGLCCTSDELYEDLASILECMNKQENSSLHITNLPVNGEYKYKEALLSMLDHADLIDHGTNISVSWLTPRGKRFAQLLT